MQCSQDSSVNIMEEGDASPLEITKRKAAANAYLNLSKKSSSKIKRVTSLLRSKQNEKSLTEEEQRFLADNSKLVDQFHKRKEKREIYQARHIETEDSPEVLRQKCAQLAQAIHDSEFLVVYTGAGISTAASIPDYRGPNGIWTRLSKGEDIGTHDLTEAEPTLTHMALSALMQCSKLSHVVSQNCDGLHLRSGLPKTFLSEVHGNMYIEVCVKCSPAREYVRTFDVTERTSTFKHQTGRKCYKCGTPLIDSIVHFGERGKLRWPLNWQGACQAASAADTILCLGSSLKVLKKYPWLWQMDRPAKRRPRLYVVNLQWTPKDKEATVKINGKCDEVMAIVMQMLGMKIPSYNRSEDLMFEFSTALHPEEECTTTRPCLVEPSKDSDSEEGDSEPKDDSLGYKSYDVSSHDSTYVNNSKCDSVSIKENPSVEANKDKLKEVKCSDSCLSANCVSCLCVSSVSSAPCQCELTIRQLYGLGVVEKILKCPTCGLFLTFHVKGTCSVSKICSVYWLFCQCDDVDSKVKLEDVKEPVIAKKELEDSELKVKKEELTDPSCEKVSQSNDCSSNVLDSESSGSSISTTPDISESKSVEEISPNTPLQAKVKTVTSPEVFYGTGLCIRSQCTNETDTSSQDEVEEDFSEMESMQESEIESEGTDIEEIMNESDTDTADNNVQNENQSELNEETNSNKENRNLVLSSSCKVSNDATVNNSKLSECSFSYIGSNCLLNSDAEQMNSRNILSFDRGADITETTGTFRARAKVFDNYDEDSQPLKDSMRENKVSPKMNGISCVDDSDDVEMKSIWFNSFCKRKQEAINQSLDEVNSDVGVKVTDDVKHLWFWGFDDKMIKSKEGLEKLKKLSEERLNLIDEDSNSCSTYDSTDASDSEAPRRRFTRSTLVSKSDSKEEDSDSECELCEGFNPDLCRRSKEVQQVIPDEDMLRVRTSIAKKRIVNYKRFDPVFTVRLKSFIVEKGKRKSKGKLDHSKDTKIRKITMNRDAEECEEEGDKVEAKKTTPGWFGKGYRKIIKKKVAKSYPLKL